MGKDEFPWKNRYYVLAYELVAEGCGLDDLPDSLGVPAAVWKKWVARDRTLKETLRRAREKFTGSKSPTVQSPEPVYRYVYQHLPKELKEVWKKIERAFLPSEEGGLEDPERFVEAIMLDHGVRARQSIFVHCLVCRNFDGNVASKMTGVSPSEVAKWAEQDVEFGRLIQEIEVIKDNFIEGAAFKLIARGDSPMTIAATKARLKKRGWDYGKDVRVQQTADVRSVHIEVGETELDRMTPEEQRLVLEAARALRAARSRKELPPREVSGEVINTENILSQGQ